MLPEEGLDPATAGRILLEAPTMEVEDWEEMKDQLIDEMSG